MAERIIKILSLSMIMFSTFIFTYILVVNLDNKPIANHSYILLFIFLVLLFDGITLHGITSGKFRQTTNLYSLKTYILLTIVAPIITSSLAYLITSMRTPTRWDIIGSAFYKTYLIVFGVCFVAQIFYFFRAYLESRKREST